MNTLLTHLGIFAVLASPFAAAAGLRLVATTSGRRRSRTRLAACVAVAVTVGGLADAGERWIGFQGPIAADVRAASLPLEWTPTENVAWKAEVPGYGQSSPVVWDESMYVTSVSGDMKENFHVTAWTLDGKQRWQHDVVAASQLKNSNYVSRAAPTPVVDQAGLVVLLESGNLLALDHDGKVVWERDLVKEFGAVDSRHGLSSSVLAVGGHVVAWIEREKDPYLLAVERPTGKTAWKVEGLGATSWSTPTLLDVGNGETHLVLSGSGKLAGLNAKTGERLWSLEGIGGNTVARPQPIGTGLLLVGASEGRGGATAGAGPDSNGVVKVAKSDDGWAADFVWRAERATSSFGSPIVHRGLAYFVNRTGVLFCLDAKTGEERYAERLPESIWATPIAVEDRVYFVGKSGTTAVVKAGDEFEILAENRSWEAGGGARKPGDFSGPVQYAAVALHDRLLVRRGDVVYCFAKESQPEGE